jgi:hypothetical protein
MVLELVDAGYKETERHMEKRTCQQLNFILIIKQSNRTNFSNLFWNETLYVSDSSSVHHQEFFTVHTAIVYVIQVCRQLASRIRIELSYIMILLERCLQTCMTYTNAVCTVKNSWWWTEELSETNRVSIRNKFEKLVRLVVFIIRIRHDARSHERKIEFHITSWERAIYLIRPAACRCAVHGSNNKTMS